MAEEKKKHDDMRVEPVDGAPISLHKVLENDGELPEGATDRGMKVLIDNTGLGIMNDTNMPTISVAEREKQADYFLSLNVPMQPHMRKYLEMMYTDNEDIDAMYKYASTNHEMKQIIGMIQLVGGSLNIAKKAGQAISLYVEEPEAKLHPKREQRIMSMMNALRDEYGFKPPEQTTK